MVKEDCSDGEVRRKASNVQSNARSNPLEMED